MLTRVHSWGLVDLDELLLATVAKEGVKLAELAELAELIELVELFELVRLVKLVEIVALVETFVRALALDSI